MREIATPDPVVETVCELVADHHAGVLCDWPDAYPAGLVEGVRYVLAELNHRPEN